MKVVIFIQKKGMETTVLSLYEAQKKGYHDPQIVIQQNSQKIRSQNTQ
jgi:hypothetical protein